MPLPTLMALVVAFGLDFELERGSLSRPALAARIYETLGGIATVAALAFVLGHLIAWRVYRSGKASTSTRRILIWGERLIELLSLAVFVWTLYYVGWRRVVDWGFHLRGYVLIEEMVILLPFFLVQLLSWWGLYAGEKAVRTAHPIAGLGRHLVLRARQSMGTILPVAMVYAVGHDIMRTHMPELAKDPVVRMLGIAGMGAFVLVLAPAFVRLTWPTQSLPPGPVRSRLERLAGRLRFRYTDILVWDTGGVVVNAGVTGALPWYRYVLITDEMLTRLDEREIEAVFGHEVGHIAHRHLVYFGFFVVGSMGVVALAAWGFDQLLPSTSAVLSWLGDSWYADLVREGSLLLPLGLYFVIVFGVVSRRFERQADVFGCRAVSCGRDQCPPHDDVNADRESCRLPDQLCPVGIRTFANALASVAILNEIDPDARSWRHGSIRRRIKFLEGLESRPEAERRFQAGVVRLRVALAVLLIVAVATAAALGALDKLG
jgi:STE24 endopeptidase